MTVSGWPRDVEGSKIEHQGLVLGPGRWSIDSHRLNRKGDVPFGLLLARCRAALDGTPLGVLAANRQTLRPQRSDV